MAEENKQKYFAKQSKNKKEMNGLPFKWQTKAREYQPKGIPKVKFPKVKIREPKFPKVDRIFKLKLK